MTKLTPLPPHHVAWLSAHSERDESWFRKQITEGFDIHHLDCDHSNNDPKNLVMIEANDHMRLHNLPFKRLIKEDKEKKKIEAAQKREQRKLAKIVEKLAAKEEQKRLEQEMINNHLPEVKPKIEPKPGSTWGILKPRNIDHSFTRYL